MLLAHGRGPGRGAWAAVAALAALRRVRLFGAHRRGAGARPRVRRRSGAACVLVEPPGDLDQREELWVESEIDSDFDGKLDRIHADVSRVAETETQGLKVPVVFEVSPYYGGSVDVVNWAVDHEIGEPPATRPVTSPVFFNTSPTISRSHESTWVPRGFAVVHAEGTGTGLSEGCPTSGAPNETLGPKAVIDWLNGRARGTRAPPPNEQVFATWTTGKVGMIGTSYNGTLPIGVATTGVEGLEAIVPISAISSWYDYYRANGAVRAPGGFQGEDLDVLAEYTYTRPDQIICRGCDRRHRRHAGPGDGRLQPDLGHPQLHERIANVRAASLVAHGNNDWNVMTKHASVYYQALKERGLPHQLYWHQGGHGGSPPLVRTNRWFTHYLWGVENGVENDPRAWVVREGQSSQNPTPYPEWPDPAAAKTTLVFKGNGLEVGELTLKGGKPVEETLVDDATISPVALLNAAASPQWARLQEHAAPHARPDQRHADDPAQAGLQQAEGERNGVPDQLSDRHRQRDGHQPRLDRSGESNLSGRDGADRYREALQAELRPAAEGLRRRGGPAARGHDPLERPRLHDPSGSGHEADDGSQEESAEPADRRGRLVVRERVRLVAMEKRGAPDPSGRPSCFSAEECKDSGLRLSPSG